MVVLVDELEVADAIDDLLDQVSAGEEVWITRLGKVVAKLYPCDDPL
jgi:antitoxin (DNA-binding transcriptional repressor) of toxin-antitoxin stability system